MRHPPQYIHLPLLPMTRGSGSCRATPRASTVKLSIMSTLLQKSITTLDSTDSVHGSVLYVGVLCECVGFYHCDAGVLRNWIIKSKYVLVAWNVQQHQ
mmetsp:Transcript_2002/g.7210  ORF Transcript_2002/g.7210 Transcript_2002/m.7210 type:complete len:98 (-) Transcript_2002:130-423(-)